MWWLQGDTARKCTFSLLDMQDCSSSSWNCTYSTLICLSSFHYLKWSRSLFDSLLHQTLLFFSYVDMCLFISYTVGLEIFAVKTFSRFSWSGSNSENKICQIEFTRQAFNTWHTAITITTKIKFAKYSCNTPKHKFAKISSPTVSPSMTCFAFCLAVTHKCVGRQAHVGASCDTNLGETFSLACA